MATYADCKNKEVDIASGRFAEVVTQMKVVKSYVQEKLEHRHFRVRYHKTIDLTRKQSRYWHNMDVARGMVLSVIFFGNLCVYIRSDSWNDTLL